MNRRNLLRLAALTLLLTSASSAGSAGWIAGKAWLAQHLLQQSWQQSLARGQGVRPWPWADITPVARLLDQTGAKSLLVLGDASGEAMAFGPALIAGDPSHGRQHTVAIGGHRDTHLSFLQHRQIGERLSLQNLKGETLHYRILDRQIVDTRTQSVSVARDTPGLVLVTCYPFNASQTGGPLRLLVRAAPIDEGRG